MCEVIPSLPSPRRFGCRLCPSHSYLLPFLVLYCTTVHDLPCRLSSMCCSPPYVEAVHVRQRCCTVLTAIHLQIMRIHNTKMVSEASLGNNKASAAGGIHCPLSLRFWPLLLFSSSWRVGRFSGLLLAKNCVVQQLLQLPADTLPRFLQAWGSSGSKQWPRPQVSQLSSQSHHRLSRVEEPENVVEREGMSPWSGEEYVHISLLKGDTPHKVPGLPAPDFFLPCRAWKLMSHSLHR